MLTYIIRFTGFPPPMVQEVWGRQSAGRVKPPERMSAPMRSSLLRPNTTLLSNEKNLFDHFRKAKQKAVRYCHGIA
jgi:hypothetical protein